MNRQEARDQDLQSSCVGDLDHVENGANLKCEACEEVVAIKFSSFDQ